MKTNNKLHDPVAHDANRERFAREQDIRSQQQRNGMFTMPLGLTIGDNSTCYATFRKERKDVGAIKPMSVGPCRKIGNLNSTFEPIRSNAVGDPYVDAG